MDAIGGGILLLILTGISLFFAILIIALPIFVWRIHINISNIYELMLAKENDGIIDLVNVVKKGSTYLA